MSTEPNIHDLIHKLFEKIEVLERKIDCLSLNSNEVNISQIRTIKGLPPEPASNIVEWLNNIRITHDCILLVTSSILHAFQTVTKSALLDCDSPIFKHNNKLYTFDQTNKWVQWDDDNLNLLVLEIWRKFMKTHVEMTYDHEELYLAQRKQILDMRRKILDVKKTRNELNVWLKQIL